MQVRYWWVSQNKTYQDERRDGYLWSPHADPNGNPFHWANMERVEPGDVIFSYVGMGFPSIAVAQSAAYEHPRPAYKGAAGAWDDPDGLRVDVGYRDIRPVPQLQGILQQLGLLLPEKYSPLTRTGTGSQGYLYELPTRAGRLLLSYVGIIAGEDPAQTIGDLACHAASETEREALIQSRIGQGKFRAQLLKLWQGQCCVSGVSTASLIRASHIKPWAESNNSERLDPFNGLPLNVAYDVAFDAGLITFEDDGQIRLSPHISPIELRRLGVELGARIAGLQAAHYPYLAYHRREVFRS